MMSISLSLSDPLPAKPGTLWARITRALRASVAQVDRAHSSRCELACLPDDIQRDTGLTPEEATGIRTFQPALPFFMQSGFGGK